MYLKTHVIPKMKTKRKEKEKKKKKRSEENKVPPRFELELLGAPSESFATRPRGNFIIKIFEPYET